jgi:hypothetical protein
VAPFADKYRITLGTFTFDCVSSGPANWFNVDTQLSRYSDWLRTVRSGDRIPVGARLSAPVQTGPGAHPASDTVGTGSLSRGVKRPGRGVDHPPLSYAEVIKKSRAIPLLPLWAFVVCSRVNFTAHLRCLSWLHYDTEDLHVPGTWWIPHSRDAASHEICCYVFL